MKLPEPKKIKVDNYPGGLSKIPNVENAIKLSANESALGPSPKVINFLKNSSQLIKRYPDSKSNTLKEAISKKFNLNVENILVGSGSDEIISLICQSFLKEEDEVIVSENSFLMYRIYSQLNGAIVKYAKDNNNKFCLSEAIKLVTNKTKIVFIANPNNPTGTYLTKQEMIDLRKSLPDNILLMVDDAYSEFMQEKDYSSGLDIFSGSANVVVCRTFSKIYGLANLRLGWGFASKDIINAANVFKPPFNISSVAEEAGCLALNDDSWLKKNIEHNNKWANIIHSALNKKNIICNKPTANFFLMNFDKATKNADQAFEIFARNKLILRQMSAYKIKNSLRVTVGTEEENKTFLDVLESNF